MMRERGFASVAELHAWSVRILLAVAERGALANGWWLIPPRVGSRSIRDRNHNSA